MAINYQPTTWVNNQNPPISADNLNHIEQGIKSTADRVDELVTVEANPSDTPTATMESLEVDGTIYKVGGGHAVKDSSGNTMTQRENLQFTDAHTSDDSQGNTTKVEIAKQVTSQEWENATEKGFYLIGDDDDYLLDISQVANADAAHLPYSSSKSTKQAIDDALKTDLFDVTYDQDVESVVHKSHYINSKVVHIFEIIKIKNSFSGNHTLITFSKTAAANGMTIVLFQGNSQWGVYSNIKYGYIGQTLIMVNDSFTANQYVLIDTITVMS